jgi:hypothetical protein
MAKMETFGGFWWDWCANISELLCLTHFDPLHGPDRAEEIHHVAAEQVEAIRNRLVWTGYPGVQPIRKASLEARDPWSRPSPQSCSRTAQLRGSSSSWSLPHCPRKMDLLDLENPWTKWRVIVGKIELNGEFSSKPRLIAGGLICGLALFL